MRRHDTDLIDHSRFEGTLCLSFDELSCAEWHNDEAVTVVSTAELDALLAERDALRARKAVGKWQLLNGGEGRVLVLASNGRMCVIVPCGRFLVACVPCCWFF